GGVRRVCREARVAGRRLRAGRQAGRGTLTAADVITLPPALQQHGTAAFLTPLDVRPIKSHLPARREDLQEDRMAPIHRRGLLKGVTALGVASAVTHAVPAQVAAQTTQKRELVVAQGGDIAHFDPHMSTSANDIRISFNLFDNLVSRHPDQKLYPGLATEWKL